MANCVFQQFLYFLLYNCTHLYQFYMEVQDEERI